MRVFVTGATGFIGTAVVRDLIKAGHGVLGLTRSEAGAAALTAAGAEPHHGDLEDLDSLRAGAEKSDGVIHTAFVHDFSKFAENGQIDRRAIETLGAALAGTDRPLVVTSGTGFPAPGGLATEDLPAPTNFPRVSEPTALRFADTGVRVCTVRLPQVHDTRKFGLVSYMIASAQQTGISAYSGDGANRWPSVHLDDAAALYLAVLSHGKNRGAYNAVSEEGTPTKAIAEAIGAGLKIRTVSQTPEETAAHFGPLAYFMGVDMPASSAITQRELGWRPVVTTSLLADLENATDFATVA